ADCELVLRFYAIRDALTSEARGSLRSLLDRAMKTHAADPETALPPLRDDFQRCLKELVGIFADLTFRLPTTGRLSRPLYDALMVALSLNPHLRPSEEATGVRERLDAALAEARTYDILVGRGNTIDAIK